MENSRRVFIGGNWKCNGDSNFIETHVKFLNDLQFDENKCQVCVCPTMIHLQHVRKILNDKIIVSSQNVSMFDSGAYTGEVSAKLLKDINVHWTLVGHSERRQYFGDTEEVIGHKIKQCLANGVSVIACIGEKLNEREEGRTMDVCIHQLKTIAANVTSWDNIVIAYEPVWAIGTGKTASPQQAQEVHFEIRKWITSNVSEDVASKIRIIYGGSVTDSNCNELILEKDIDGFLVGGASLKTGFKTIVDTHSRK
jgi:triosephosphate isomerase